jgi:5'-methylthioadenosine phosphorylase
VLKANAVLAQEIIRQVVPLIGGGFDSPAHHALATAIITDRAAIAPEKRQQVALLVEKYLK